MVCHVTGHALLVHQGNEKADTLVKVRWVDTSPIRDMVQWLHWHPLHAGQKTIWAMGKTWKLPISYADVLTACKQYVCSKEHPLRSLASDGQIMLAEFP